MADVPKPNEQPLAPMFPKLTEAQIARLMHFGRRRLIKAGEIIFEQGERKRSLYVILRGRLEIVTTSQHPAAPQAETVIGVQEPGDFTGELDMLSGRKSLVRSRAAQDGELLEISLDDLKRIVQTDAELSEIFLRAFLLRRAFLIEHSPGDVLLIGSTHSA